MNRNGDAAHLSSNNMRNTHLVIINDVREMIRRQSIALPENKIFERLRRILDWLVDQIILRQTFARALHSQVARQRAARKRFERIATLARGRKKRHLVSDGMREVAIELALHFGRREMQTVSVVGGSSIELSLLADGIESFGAAEAAIRFVRL